MSGITGCVGQSVGPRGQGVGATEAHYGKTHANGANMPKVVK